MTATNISLDRYKQRFFGEFLELPDSQKLL